MSADSDGAGLIAGIDDDRLWFSAAQIRAWDYAVTILATRFSHSDAVSVPAYDRNSIDALLSGDLRVYTGHLSKTMA